MEKACAEYFFSFKTIVKQNPFNSWPDPPPPPKKGRKSTKKKQKNKKHTIKSTTIKNKNPTISFSYVALYVISKIVGSIFHKETE